MNWLRIHPDLALCALFILAALAGRALALLGV